MAPEDNIVLIELGMVAPPGESVSLADWNALKGQVDTLVPLVPGTLANLTDVVIAGPTEGQMLVYEAATGKWKNTSPNTSINLYASNGDLIGPASRLDMGAGLSGTSIDATRKRLDVVFAGTGSANTAARSDHTHSPVVFNDFDFAATGALSSGMRTLVNSNLTGLDASKSYFVTADLEFTMRNNVNSGTVTAAVRIGASASYPAKSKERRAVGGVDRQVFVRHQRPVSGASTVQITATVASTSGDEMDIRDGVVYVSAIPQS